MGSLRIYLLTHRVHCGTRIQLRPCVRALPPTRTPFESAPAGRPVLLAMSGRQYNMYNSQTAEGWKQRILKENLHNAPSLRVFADLEADDDNQSVSSIGSRATGVTRASVASSKASMASTAALSRVRKPHSPCLSAPTLSLSLRRHALSSLCSYTRHSGGPLVSPTHRHMPRAESPLHAHSARHTCRAVLPTALCRLAGVPSQALALTPTTRAAPPSISLGRSRSSRRSSRPSDSARPTLPCPVRAGPGGAGLRRSTPSPPRPARPTRDPPSCTSAPRAHLNPAGRAQEAAGGLDPAHGGPGNRQAGRGQVTSLHCSLDATQVSTCSRLEQCSGSSATWARSLNFSFLIRISISITIL